MYQPGNGGAGQGCAAGRLLRSFWRHRRRAPMIIVLDPSADLFTRMIEPKNSVSIDQQFVSRIRPLKLSQKTRCAWLPRRNVTPLDPVLSRPRQDGVQGELRPVVRENHARPATSRG